MSSSQEHLWSVSSLCAAVEDAFNRSWPVIALAGEISNYTQAASGHCYFTLKDANAQLRCVMFRRALQGINFTPANGLQVEVRAKLSLYAARGDLQLQVQSMARPSAGGLHEQFLRIKAKLEAEGLFDPARKRPLPTFPQRLGLVTSAAGAALHDVSDTLARRAPDIQWVFAAASVQGVTAPQELIAALRKLYRQPLDAILLVRGGGSAEDLSAFNDEQLARTIAASPVPLISGVGHETDFSIADFVADQRAATPTAAAELAAPERNALLAELQQLQTAAHYATHKRLQQQAQGLDYAQMQINAARGQTVAQQNALLQKLQQRLRHSLSERQQSAQHALALLRIQCINSTRQALQQRQLALGLCEQRLLTVQTKRAQSSVLLRTASGHAVSSIHDVHAGDALQAVLRDGLLNLSVLGSQPPAQ